MGNTEQQAGNAHVQALIAAGRDKLTQGDSTEAYNLLRQAAALDPHDEQVWLALLDVVQTEEDRRICLQNIAKINPNNVAAAQQLRMLELFLGVEPAVVLSPVEPSWTARFLAAFLRVVKVFVVMAALLCLLGLGVILAAMWNLI